MPTDAQHSNRREIHKFKLIHNLTCQTSCTWLITINQQEHMAYLNQDYMTPQSQHCFSQTEYTYTDYPNQKCPNKTKTKSWLYKYKANNNKK